MMTDKEQPDAGQKEKVEPTEVRQEGVPFPERKRIRPPCSTLRFPVLVLVLFILYSPCSFERTVELSPVNSQAG